MAAVPIFACARRLYRRPVAWTIISAVMLRLML